MYFPLESVLSQERFLSPNGRAEISTLEIGKPVSSSITLPDMLVPRCKPKSMPSMGDLPLTMTGSALPQPSGPTSLK